MKKEFKKHKYIKRLFEGIILCDEFDDAKFKYATSRTYKSLRDIYDSYQDSISACQRKWMKKDAEGNSVIVGNMIMMSDQESYMKEFKELENMEVEVEIYYIKSSELPEKITSGQRIAIIDMIIEEEE